MGAKPDGPDPILFTQSDMRLLKKRIKGVIERNLGSGDSTHPLLKSSSKDFFERSEKAWRPMMTLLLSSAFAELKAQQQQHQQQQPGAAPSAHHDDAMTVSEIVEIMHTSTLIHDTVLEEYEALEKGNVAHRLYSSSLAGNKVSILAGDFLLSRASVLLASLRRTQIVEIMAGALEAIMKGQMQLHRPMQQELTVAQYVRNIELRTATLLASGCECAAIVAGFERGSAVAAAAFEYGRHVGIAYQLVSDLQATQGNFEKLLRKMEACVLEDGRTSDCSFDPYELNEPLQRAGALIFAAERDPALAAQVQRGFDSVEGLIAARDAIDACFAVEEVSALAARHARLAVDALHAALPASGARSGLELLAHYVVDPEQSRLKRANYKEGVFTEPAAPSRRDRIRSTLTNARKGAKIGLFSMREQVKEGLQRVSDSVQQLIQGI
jgi:geranylgeranyl pyrophosphate synthase